MNDPIIVYPMFADMLAASARIYTWLQCILRLEFALVFVLHVDFDKFLGQLAPFGCCDNHANTTNHQCATACKEENIVEINALLPMASMTFLMIS